MYPTQVDGLVLLDPMLPTAFMQLHANCSGIPTHPNDEALDVCALMQKPDQRRLSHRMCPS